MKMDDTLAQNRRDGTNGLTSDTGSERSQGPSENLLEVIDASNAQNCNTSGNRPFAEVLKSRASRRAILAGGLGLAASAFFQPAESALARGGKKGWGKHHKPLIGFTPVAVADGNGPTPTISPDYAYQVLIPWGDPLEPGGPSYNGDPTNRPTAAEQLRQIGIGHDGMWFFPKAYSHQAWELPPLLETLHGPLHARHARYQPRVRQQRPRSR